MKESRKMEQNFYARRQAETDGQTKKLLKEQEGVQNSL